MPFYEAVGRDTRTFKSRTLQLSARDDREAIEAAHGHGITEIKLRPYAERELLMMDLKCFLNAEPGVAQALPVRTKPRSQQLTGRTTSLLLDRPLLTITGAVLMALTIDRLIDALIVLF